MGSTLTKKLRRKELKQKRKNRRLKKREERSVRLANFAIELNRNLPKSEFWFQSLWKLKKMEDINDKYNEPVHKWILDVCNHEYKYVIEVDGSYHLLPHQIIKDQKKEQNIKSHGYKFFRIKAYDQKQFEQLCISIQIHRMNIRNKTRTVAPSFPIKTIIKKRIKNYE